MSSLPGRVLAALRGQRRWRLGGLVLIGLALMATGTTLAARSGGAPTGNQLTANRGEGSAAQNGSGGGAPGSGQLGTAVPSPSGSSSARAGGQAGATASAKASSTPARSPYPTPTYGDAIQGIPDLKTSNCLGYPPGVTCQVYYHGNYYLVSRPAAKVVIEALVDGKVVASQTYQGPGGAHTFGTTLKFQVPSGSKEVDYQSFLDDLSGNQLAASFRNQTYPS
jgi:hypothetical protein